jgi:hypothetical protein
MPDEKFEGYGTNSAYGMSDWELDKSGNNYSASFSTSTSDLFLSYCIKILPPSY